MERFSEFKGIEMFGRSMFGVEALLDLVNCGARGNPISLNREW